MALEGMQLGQYRLLSLLGSGGMGEVYLAEDARINQQVAIKVSRTEATPGPNNSTTQDAVRLFQREAKAIARLDHPHILSLFNYGEEHINGMILTYIVMPYRHEGSFVDWLQQHGNGEMLSAQDAAYFMRQAADALQHAHDNQIIHQDVKASNFLIRTNKEHSKLPDLLLADFGIAKLSTATSRVSHSVRGTPTYMAPEQWSGEPVYATDQYALAVLAYELLAGRPPFEGRQEQVMYQHLSVQPQPPSVFNPQLIQDVDAVILKALAKQPGDRFPSVSAFADALQLATRDLDGTTVVKSLYIPEGGDLHATLAISKVEAQSGTRRTLTLPGGRRVSVPVPAGAYDGQVLRLPGLGEPTYESGQGGTLVLTLSVQETDEIASSAQRNNFDQAIPASDPYLSDKTTLSPNRSNAPSIRHPPPFAPHPAETHAPQPVTRQHGISTGTAILFVGLAFLVILGSLGFFYLYGINHMPPTVASTVPTTQNRDATHFATPPATQTNTVNVTAPATVSNTATSSSYVQLKPSYSGTASGYADGIITFTLESEDQQGNISMQTTFQQLGGTQKTASYSCQGLVTTDRHMNLQCHNVTDSSYVLTVQGYVYADGHMEGTETATNTNDPTYNHVYSWKAY